MKRFIPALAAAALFAWSAPATAERPAPDPAAEDAALAEDDGNGPYRQAYDKAARILAAAYPDMAPEEVERVTLYILGNTVNTLFHEYGHGLVSELGLPIVAREEDAVDNLANIIMVAKTTDPTLDRMLRAVADDYFANGQFADDSGEVAEGWDEHSPDKARAYDVICILVGADPDSYKEAADNSGMPAERQEACAGEYEAKLEAWDKLLGPYYLKEGERNKKVAVSYGKPAPNAAVMADLVRESGIMQVVTDEILAMVKLPHDIAAVAESCDDANAYWSPDERKLTLCYEIVQSYYDNVTGNIAADDAAPGGEAGDTADGAPEDEDPPPP